MALFIYLLTKRGGENFAKAAGKLGVNVKLMNDEAAVLDRQLERNYSHYKPPLEPEEEEHLAEVNRQIRIPSKWRKRLG